jgi:hypothetical protein
MPAASAKHVHRICACPRASRLTLDMSGAWKRAKHLEGARSMEGLAACFDMRHLNDMREPLLQ